MRVITLRCRWSIAIRSDDRRGTQTAYIVACALEDLENAAGARDRSVLWLGSSPTYSRSGGLGGGSVESLGEAVEVAQRSFALVLVLDALPALGAGDGGQRRMLAPPGLD